MGKMKYATTTEGNVPIMKESGPLSTSNKAA